MTYRRISVVKIKMIADKARRRQKASKLFAAAALTGRENFLLISQPGG
jgi:hypothetical protein